MPPYLRYLPPLTALLTTLASALALFYPPLRDQSAVIPAVALVLVLAVFVATAAAHLGWRRLEHDVAGALTSDPAGVLAAVEHDVAPVVALATPAGHSPAEVLSAAATLLKEALVAVPPPGSPPAA